ncbi:MAG: fibrobacter succinogenes major paralogous domain-containing protein [Muribaculaceae bacterium]|nr:fibrobacter succinogenes major paralogous domain-containing protein [Muribaculaceae bacterium]
MNKVLLKTTVAVTAVAALLSVTACTDSNEPATAIGAGDGTVPIVIKGMPSQAALEAASEELSELNVFHFKGDDFLFRTDVEDPYAETIGLPTNGTTRAYCVAGIQLEVAEGTKESDFRNLTVSCEANAAHSPLFYTGSIDFSEENLSGGRLEIEMKRGVARIDFVNNEDPDIKVMKIIVEDAPATSYIIPQEDAAEGSTISFTREFAQPFFGEEQGMFTLFESASPVHVRIIGEYKDSPLNILTTLPAAERNKLYTLQIVNINSSGEGAFTVKEWEEGKQVAAVPSSANLMIDRLNSVVPAGVEVNYGTNTVSVPFAGANNIKLAFVAKTKVTISDIEGEIPTVKVVSNDPIMVDQGYISSFNLSVEPNKRLPYSVIINVKDEEERYNFVEVKVLSNPTRTIETVEIAGSTWMAFNCNGPELDMQIYPVDGLSIEETYIKNWLGAAGCLYQFGRQYSYTPYLAYSPSNNLGDQVQDLPWVNYSHMPCPEGYHVATLEEFRSLCPQNTPIPGTYKAGNGESITVTVHAVDDQIVTPTKVGGVPRYMKFKSNDTGNELILPICGYKSDKSGASNPLFGKDVVYWTNSNASCKGGHARAFRFMFNYGDESKMDEFQWPMEAFAYVRAVKNVETTEE